MRRGATLVEMAAMLGIAATILAGAFDGMVRLRRLAAADPAIGTRAELVCSLLRRDLAAGAVRRDGAELRTAKARWQVEDGQLLRDGRLQIRVAAFAVEEADGRLAVLITPVGLPARRIEVP